jgi:choline transport protein
MQCILGSDAPAHISEEVQDAALVVPRSMFWSYVLNVPPTFAMLLAYLFCIGDLESAVASPTGFPFIYVFQNATGSPRAATALTFIVFILIIFVAASTVASTSRQTFAFARDRGLPFSSWLSQVCPSLKEIYPS